MNRRTLLTRIFQSSVGLLAVCSARPVRGGVPVNAIMTFAPSSWRAEVARRMVNESGEMWLAVRERYMGRNPILIAFDDNLGVDVIRSRNYWTLTERALTAEEIAGRDQCRLEHRPAFYTFPAYKTAPLPKIGDRVVNTSYRLRAWIKNGRAPYWQMSIDGFKKPITL